MEKQHVEQLIKIYNTFSLIETRGENTLMMADSLRALKVLIQELQKKEV